MTVKQIRISKKPNFIIVTNSQTTVYNYHLDNLKTKNKQCDSGAWKIKYKTIKL
jgi:hypothetical protein